MNGGRGDEGEPEQVGVVEAFHPDAHLDEEDDRDLREPDNDREVGCLPLEDVDEEDGARGPKEGGADHVDEVDGIRGQGTKSRGKDRTVGRQES